MSPSQQPKSVPSPVRIVFCDMDGTLFTPDPEHIITKETARTICTLQDTKQALFVVSTGRPSSDVFPTVKDAGIHPDYYITSNGARIHDRDHKLVFDVSMDTKVPLDLLQLPCTPHADGTVDETCAPRCFVTNINCKDEGLTNKSLPEVAAVFHPSYQYQQVDPGAVTAEQLQGTHSVWLRGEEADLACVDKYIQRKYAGVVESKFALSFVLDVFPHTANKGVAVRKVCELLDVDPADAAAIGDGDNDLTMMKVVGHPFIMSNASRRLKDALPHAKVIGSNSEEGVAKKLHELFHL